MLHSEFRIGIEFTTEAMGSERRWRCTDVGTRTVAAIRVDRGEIASFRDDVETRRTVSGSEMEALGLFRGPPYAVAEVLFDEYDIEGCEMIGDRA